MLGLVAALGYGFGLSLIVVCFMFWSVDRRKIFGMFGGILVAFLLILSGYLLTYQTPSNETYTTSTNIWYTDAPFGTYWVDVEGGGNFIHFRIYSEFKESYTVKWWSGDELMSMHFTTDEIRVYKTEDMNKMTLTHTYIYSHWLDEESLDSESYCLYIPNPDLYGEAK